MLRFTSLIFGLGILGCFGFANGLAVTPTSTSTRYSNSTSPVSSSSLSATTSACCFVVLDTIYENWWQEVSTSTYHNIVNLTSITTLITPYPTVTSTNYETNVYTTNATFYLEVDIGFDPIMLYTNDASGPKEISTVLNANGTQGAVNQALTAVTTGGTTIHSPQAFWAYSTVRIITAAAVTDKSGNKVCGTKSAFQSAFPIYSLTTLGHTSSLYPVLSTLATRTTTLSDELVFTGINSNVNSYFFTNQTATQTGVVISLTTPFVYAPTRGATLVSGEPRPCDQGSGTENYGYPVQTLLDYLVQNPVYSSQYPGLENCLAGGPEIIQLEECSAAAPVFESPGGDLTSSTVITVTPTGVTAQPVSVASPTQAAPTSTETVLLLPESTQTSETSPVVSAMPSETPTPSPSANPGPSPSTESPAGEQTSTIPENPPSLSSSPNTPSSPETSNTEASSPSASPNAPEALSPPSAANTPASNTPDSPNILSPASSSAAIASAIASAIGATPITALPTVISGTSDLVISGATTIPVNPAVPLSGSTTVLNGVTNVILSSATTVSLSSLLASLPGSTMEVSGTLNAVLGTGASPTTVPVNSNIPGLSGSTFVSVSGSQTETFVVVSTPETIPVMLGEPTQSTAASGGVVSNSSSTAPLQFTSAASSALCGRTLMSALCGMLALSFGMMVDFI